MSKSLGPALPPTLVTRLSQTDLPSLLGRGLPLLTVDAGGRAHPMLCSYLELRAASSSRLRLAIPGGSGTARNLRERGTATLLMIEPEQTIYIKCRAAGAPAPFGILARFELVIEEVLEDSSAEWEGGARITGGIAYAPPPDLGSPEARAILAALAAD